jgi:hypothetical protein
MLNRIEEEDAMAIRIVEDLPGGGAARLGRGIVVLLGLVLLLAGLLAAILPLLWLELTLTDLVTGYSPDRPTGSDVQQIVITAIVAVVGIWAGLRLIRGRRRLGLYLRKFGFADTTRTVSHALTSSVGRSVRLVTLDDSMVAALGAGRGRRRVAGVVLLIATAVVIGVAYYLVGGAFHNDTDNLVSSLQEQAGPGVGAQIGAAVGAGVILVVILLIVGGLGTFALLLALIGAGSYRAARRAERRAVQAFTSSASVDTEARALGRAARRIFAPRLVVVAVPTAFWQRAVHALAAVSEVVIIDVSRPTDNLIWELQNIKPLFQGRWVLVGARPSVAGLARPGTAGAGTAEGLLARLLDGEQILAYGPDPADQARFARSLRRALQQARRR